MVAQIIFVEDDQDVRELILLLLNFEGFEVREFSHPRQLAALDPESPPALFLVDLMLPGMSGIEAARQLRARGFTTPMIGISASRLMLEVAAGSGLFDDTVPKPFDLGELINCLQSAIAAHTDPMPARKDRKSTQPGRAKP
jgi:DNA-binding response OmpR family regulator